MAKNTMPEMKISLDWPGSQLGTREEKIGEVDEKAL